MPQEVQMSACESREDQSDPRAETIPEIYPPNEAGETGWGAIYRYDRIQEDSRTSKLNDIFDYCTLYCCEVFYSNVIELVILKHIC